MRPLQLGAVRRFAYAGWIAKSSRRYFSPTLTLNQAMPYSEPIISLPKPDRAGLRVSPTFASIDGRCIVRCPVEL